MIEYPLAGNSWGEEEKEAIMRVIDSGNYTMGEQVRRFEEDFAAFVGKRYAVMANSGSSANLLAVAALRFRREKPLQPGDEIIVPAVSWSTTFFPLFQYGLKLKFVDIDAETLNFDLDALATAVSERTRAIMAVNLLGNPNDFAAIEAIMGEREILLIEDNCEAMGALYRGRQAGGFGIIGTFSTFFSHHISTMEGGLAVTDDEELYQIMLSLRAHGWTRQLPAENLVCGTKSDDSFKESYRFVLPGYNLRPLEISGAIGIIQLKKLPEFIRVRRENAAFFQDLFGGSPYFAIQKEIGASSWFGFSLVIKEGIPLLREKVIAALSREGIESRPIVAGDFTRNSALRWADYEIAGSLDSAARIDRKGFFVGNHHFPVVSSLKRLKDILDALTSHI